MTVDVLAIAAHPDDVEQTCGGTVIKMSEPAIAPVPISPPAHGRAAVSFRVAESEVAGRHMLLNWRQPALPRRAQHHPRMTLAVKIRELKPRVVILPYWEARHPDHYRASEIGFEACFLAGLRKLDEYSEPHRPFKILYASVYAEVKPSFIVDISAQFERRMTALLSYTSQYGETIEGGTLFPNEQEIRERLGAVARFYGNLIGVKYGEPFVVKEAMQIDDVVAMGSRSI
jgi:bacillithiol biosynthesis deacetylase BshB1